LVERLSLSFQTKISFTILYKLKDNYGYRKEEEGK
jgi:hypothetical protein